MMEQHRKLGQQQHKLGKQEQHMLVQLEQHKLEQHNQDHKPWCNRNRCCSHSHDQTSHAIHRTSHTSGKRERQHMGNRILHCHSNVDGIRNLCCSRCCNHNQGQQRTLVQQQHKLGKQEQHR
jgi:hypothetical protein